MIVWAPAMASFAIPAGPGRSSDRPPTVLLIEDDVAIANMYRLQLAADGLRVIQAFDGEDGLDAIRKSHPDLVLLDIRLPKMEGLTVLQRVRDDPAIAATPVLILSNYGDPGIVERGLALGARDYLVKSRTTPIELSLKVRAQLPGGTAD